MPPVRNIRTPRIRIRTIEEPQHLYPVDERDFAIQAVLTLQRLDNVISVRIHNPIEASLYRRILPFATVHRSRDNLFHFLSTFRYGDESIERVKILAKFLGHTIVSLRDPRRPRPRLGSEANPIVIVDEEPKGKGSASDPIVL